MPQLLELPQLEGLDGVNKMSKSLGNYIGITEPPQEIFGKIMSVSDELMWRYYELLSLNHSLQDIARMKERTVAGENPRNYKVALAQEIVERFHGKQAAIDALGEFERVHRQGALPENIPEVTLTAEGDVIGIAQALKQAGLTSSTSEALRMVEQGAVKLDETKVTDKGLSLARGTTVIAQVGKRKFARIQIK